MMYNIYQKCISIFGLKTSYLIQDVWHKQERFETCFKDRPKTGYETGL